MDTKFHFILKTETFFYYYVICNRIKNVTKIFFNQNFYIFNCLKKKNIPSADGTWAIFLPSP